MKILSDAADFMSGGTPNKANPAFWGGDIPWYSASNMTDRFIGNGSPKITYEGLIAGSKMAPKGSTLILVRGSGLFNYIPICYVEKAVSFNQDVKAICPKDDTDPVFLHFWMESLRNTLNQNLGVTGIGAGKLDTDFLKNLPFPDLSRKKQEYIAQYVQSFDRKIDLNRRMNETLEAMARALFRDWFVDFGPTRAKIAGEAPYLAPELWELFPDRLDDEGKPEEWLDGTIGNWANLNSLSWKRQNYPETVNYLDLSSVKHGIINDISQMSAQEAPSRAQRILRTGETVIGTVRPGNGSYAYIDREGLTGSTGFACFYAEDKKFREFVYFALTDKENIDRLTHLADGGAYPAVRPDVVADTACTLSEQTVSAFHTVVSSWMNKISTNNIESHTLAQLRDLLLPKLMSGEIRIRDAEKMVEDAA